MLECDIAHRRYMAVLCMLYKNECNSIDATLHGDLPVPYVKVLVTHGALVALYC